MSNRRIAWLLLVLTALAWLPANAETLPPPALPPSTQIAPEFMGMAIRDPWYDFGTFPGKPDEPNRAFQDTMGAVLAEAGVHWVRLEFQIPGTLEASNEAIDFELSKYDYFINEVAPRHGFAVLAVLGFGLAPWNDPCDLNKPGSVDPRFGGGVNAYMAAWLSRALRIADRFGERIAAYEILNEQNRLAACGTPAQVEVAVNGGTATKTVIAIHPKVTGRLITKFYRFCRGLAVPEGEPAHGCTAAQVVLGGLHPRGSSPPHKEETAITDQQYLSIIYADPDSFAGFFGSYGRYPVDGIGYHPYIEEIRRSPNNALVDRGIARMRSTLRAGGDPCVPFWITEVGYNVGFDIDGPNNPTPPQTEAGQAEFLRDVYTSLAVRVLDAPACAGQREVQNVFWFKYEDFPPADGSNAQRWGIVRIPFVEGGQVNDKPCPGGACYDANGTPSIYRQAFATYRSLVGSTIVRAYLPVVGR